MAETLCPRLRQYATADLVAEFIPPAGAPTWMMAMCMFYAILAMIKRKGHSYHTLCDGKRMSGWSVAVVSW